MPGYTCFFAHFNSNAGVCSYVHAYLDHLSALGFKILFISNSPIAEEDRLRLEKNTGIYRILERENKGNDFGAWQWVMTNGLIPEDTDHLLLTNDSIFGPLFNLGPLVEKMCADPSVDFWGLTDSFQGGWHIQSYFFCLNKRAFSSDAFKKVLEQDFSKFDKKNIIEKGEIRLSVELVAAGIKGTACFPYKDIDPEYGEGLLKNPTHFFWDLLIRKFKFPFIKKELILINPERIQQVGEAFALLEKETDYPVGYIKECIADHLLSRSARSAGTIFPDKISVLCHLYYPGTIYYFLSKLAVLQSPNTRFIFNLSDALAHNSHFTDILRGGFKNSILLYSPNQGRDIGGKLAALDSFLRRKEHSVYTLVMHDKISPHTPTGADWSEDLLKIIDPKVLPEVFSQFDKDDRIGIVTSGNFIKNEFDPDKGGFTCTSNDNLINYIKEFDLELTNYNFAAGTIFWIRTAILKDFFLLRSPLSIRKGLERGNALDFIKGTNIHSWERLFSFITNAQGYKTTGIR
jgi:lipopolysaccharide biosynthesis protein